ncbi:putative leucine-rich repeat receptor-like serine/threonine-protein kinase At2g24130 [Lolium rigidum]|uniref:putative leucine-rich repeat receptor-like serine/threonine-protein kinase At2g24130 n=1 Tax=Lolium rigidum TaxID=89674 RepID=UPI001F5D5143|nr:putative leucine-rich repeat receptor-like serine/threonine-protein kinase At2g24130 [Lolium rigidum]
MAATPASVLAFAFFIFFPFLHGAGGASEEDDRSTLLAFKAGVSGDPNGALAGWGASSDVCNWTGVACDMVARHVVKLVLRKQKLSGEVSPALGNLSHLRILNLSGNFFAGRIPLELGNLSRLNSLDVSSNMLAGTVPPELGNLSSLNFLDLSGNGFGGAVPPELGKLSGLKQLSLGANQFQGPIPVELTHTRNLVYLNLGENNLSGHIPAAIFCNLSALQYIDLSSNSLDGEIPIRADCPLPDLNFLVLWSNNLVGGIPRSLSNSTKLRWLLLESNFLAGELPSSEMFGGMKSLELLYLSFNYFKSSQNNTDLEPFFASLTNCTGLKELGVAGNDLAGTIPPVVGRLSPALTQLHLEFNNIFGQIPANLSDLANLTALNLSHNLINGSIPPGIAGMRRLERLYLSNNLLSGEIPPSLGNVTRLGLVDLSQNRLGGAIPGTLSDLTQLRVLALHHNDLAGAIPPSIARCANLQNLDLSHNMLGGEIPADLSGLSGLLYLNLSSNQLEGPIPATISKMTMLQVLNLSSNRLSGVIPPQLGTCIALEYLDVSRNALGGSLPETVGSLPFLEVLDVSCNGLTGHLPLSLETAASLRRVNFSYNGFSGEVPSGGAFPGFPADAFLGDAGLCVGMSSMVPGLPRCGGVQRRVLHNRRVVVPVVVTVASFAVAIFGLAACRAVARTANVGRDGRQSTLLSYGGDEWTERGDHPRISHRELSDATGGFQQSSLIGAGRFGRVYEGTLRDGTRVAVKVLDPKTGGGEVSRSFKRECDVLRRTRHRNLVRVVTTCSQPDFHALVLPLMPNGSLENRLYPRDGSAGRGMDLARLLAIAGNVAEGLAYLHHYAPVRVVHCDLKPSNVLLDDDMTAVVADFGIARLVKDVGDDGLDITGSADPCNSITGLLQGSVGYIAPEYGLGGQPSTEGDVYSFGVMILELITGKRPTDVLFQEGLTLHDWVRRHHPHNFAAVVARSWLTGRGSPVVQVDETVGADDIVAELIDLGLACTQHSPPARPTMVEVCHEITLIGEDLAKRGCAAPSVVMTVSDGSCSTTDSSF